MGIRGILRSAMQFQVVYETENLDYYETYEKLRTSPHVAYCDIDEKGCIRFSFKEIEINTKISSKGRIQPGPWTCVKEKQLFYRLLENHLVAQQGKEVVIRRRNCTIYGVTPGTVYFKVAWCNQVERHFPKGVLGFISAHGLVLGLFITLLWLLVTYPVLSAIFLLIYVVLTKVDSSAKATNARAICTQATFIRQ